MKASEYKTKAELLLKRYIESEPDKNAFEMNKEQGEIADEFLHLVFFFNSELPMYKEMLSPSGCPTFTKYDKAPEKYMRRFIHYLNEFFCNENE